jgi:hypothetical protein
MAGVEALVGAVAATGQLVEQCFCFASLLIDLRAKMKVGPQSAHEQAHYHEQLIELLSKIQEDASGRQMKDPFLQSCSEDAIQLRDIFKHLSFDAGDSSMKRLMKSVEWKAKEKEIVRICQSLQEKKATAALSMIGVLPGIVSQISMLSEKLSHFSLTVENSFGALSRDVAALRPIQTQVEVSQLSA